MEHDVVKGCSYPLCLDCVPYSSLLHPWWSGGMSHALSGASLHLQRAVGVLCVMSQWETPNKAAIYASKFGQNCCKWNARHCNSESNVFFVQWCGFVYSVASLGRDWWPVTALSLLLFHAASLGFSLKQYLFPYLCLSGDGWVSSPAHGEALKAAFGSAQGWVGSKGALPALSGRELPKFHILTGENCCWMCLLLWEGWAAGLRAGLSSLPCGGAVSLSLCADHGFSVLTLSSEQMS